ncbi:MAG: hypothetical protein PHD05_06920 [Sphaerochaetaceae bacterium]|nr:hypothetical protein [Sphaerochaetaceae bacterium]
MENKTILVIGSGYMAEEYLKVIKELGYKAIVVGRGSEKIGKLKEKYPAFQFFSGGLENFLNTNSNYPKTAINTVNVEFLRITTEQLLNAGVNKILLEKPGALTVSGLSNLAELTSDKNAKLYIAYNRRFYSAVKELQKQVELEGGILSAHFEFTEWIHTIDPALYEKETLERWIIANSSHVIDTVFHIIGNPKSLNCSVSGQNAISWHPSGSIFIGSGISDKDIPFTYHTNWQAPGRWAIEILTKKGRYYLKPMERLFVQQIGSIKIEEVALNYDIDNLFKPGLFLQTKSFLEDLNINRICTLSDHVLNFTYYMKMGGYSE